MEHSSARLGVAAGERQSRRVLLKVSVTVRRCHADDTPFREQTYTLVVSENGALILLAASVEKGEMLRLMHRITGQELDCKVVYIGPKQGDKTEVGIEFLLPGRQFWQIDFPPEGYKPPVE
jgi:PilZ domain-containing protein